VNDLAAELCECPLALARCRGFDGPPFSIAVIRSCRCGEAYNAGALQAVFKECHEQMKNKVMDHRCGPEPYMRPRKDSRTVRYFPLEVALVAACAMMDMRLLYPSFSWESEQMYVAIHA